MIEFKANSEQKLQELINISFSKKMIFSNYYGFDLSNVEYQKFKNTLLIRKKCNDFFRLFVLSDNEKDLSKVLSELSSSYAINIPSRRTIDNWIEVFKDTGFEQIAIYRRYFYSSIKKRGVGSETFACLDDLSSIKNLLFDHFSPVTGYLPDEEKLGYMIKSKQILVNRNSVTGIIEGVIGFSIEKNKCYLPFWIDKTGLGLTLLFNLFNILVDLKVPLVSFWVNEGNVKTIGIHMKLGAKPDGLVDYIFYK